MKPKVGMMLNGPLYGPMFLHQPSMERSLRNAQTPGPNGQWQYLSTKRYPSDSPRIGYLFRHGGPFHIAGRIALFIVNSFDAVFGRRSLSDTCEKHPKIFPFRTDRDSTGSIVSEVVIGRAATTRAHGNPGDVFWSTGHSIGLLLSLKDYEIITPEASTRKRVSISNVPNLGNCFLAAITTAKHASLASRILNLTQNHQASESASWRQRTAMSRHTIVYHVGIEAYAI